MPARGSFSNNEGTDIRVLGKVVQYDASWKRVARGNDNEHERRLTGNVLENHYSCGTRGRRDAKRRTAGRTSARAQQLEHLSNGQQKAHQIHGAECLVTPEKKRSLNDPVVSALRHHFCP